MAVARRERRELSKQPSLFSQAGAYDSQFFLADAEAALLDLADYVYAHTSLKPISKTLFLLSRCLCVAKLGGTVTSAAELLTAYQAIRSSLGGSAPADDFQFASVVADCEQHIPHVLKTINSVCTLTEQSDSLGLAFNTLLRGKFEGGEGLGTFLTPEEVVFPMVDMLLKVIGDECLEQLKASFLYGDICGGTGRFVYAIARRLEQRGWAPSQVAPNARLFDQSTMAVDMGKLNFLFEGMTPRFNRVGDSLIDREIGALTGQFLMLATNPPFGAGKYRWHGALTEAIPRQVLYAIGMTRSGDNADPSELFFFRNLDLLAPGGALAIVLPDGVVHSEAFRNGIFAYEEARKTHLHVAAVVSLPSVTFSLGGTVAKTSFLVVQKTEIDGPLYAAQAHHVGFVKRGKKRADDPKGNDLVAIANEFGGPEPKVGHIAACWRQHESLAPARLLHSKSNGHAASGKVLREMAAQCRDFRDHSQDGQQSYHISILDVDETGLIDIIAASRNEPMSKGLACRCGDVLMSCMNPRIWRVTVVPDLPGSWSCSPEFVVLRPKPGVDSWRLAISLHRKEVKEAIQAMATGTSSSRQRVPKNQVLSIDVPDVDVNGELAAYARWREDYYQSRLREACSYDAMHRGEDRFNWYA